ncbi:MAG: hypothetical protein MJY87_06945 [Fibrobacter sp.]|nr:hypothetical protein [Fibrobacter sp.]
MKSMIFDSMAGKTMLKRTRNGKSFGVCAALVAGSALLLSLVACSSDSRDVAGGVTDIGNSVASGVVLDVAGTPVKGARVVAYYDSWMQDSIKDSTETLSDENGRYELMVDSSANYVLYASAGSDCGFASAAAGSQSGAADSSLAGTAGSSQAGAAAVITVGPRKTYSGRIANRSTGSVRIVGSNATTALDSDGYFFFKDMPSGDITIVYTDSENPEGDELLQARVEFTTYGSRVAFVLPVLNFYQEDRSWLVTDRGSYYEEGNEGVRIFAPDNEGWVIPPAGSSSSDGSGLDSSSSDGTSLDSSAVGCAQGDCAGTTLAYLGMDGTEVVYDNDSTLAASVEYVEGVSGKAIRLKPGQFIDLDSLDPCAGDFTISLWTKWEGPNGEHQILASQRAYWSDSTSRFQWHFESARGKFMVLKSQPAVPEGFAFGDSSIVPVGEWANLVLVSENHMVSMYVNGVVVEMQDAEGNVVTAKEFVPNELDRKVPLRIGGNEIDTETWNGAIDEVVVENVAHSAEWILEKFKMAK